MGGEEGGVRVSRYRRPGKTVTFTRTILTLNTSSLESGSKVEIGSSKILAGF